MRPSVNWMIFKPFVSIIVIDELAGFKEAMIAFDGQGSLDAADTF